MEKNLDYTIISNNVGQLMLSKFDKSQNKVILTSGVSDCNMHLLYYVSGYIYIYIIIEDACVYTNSTYIYMHTIFTKWHISLHLLMTQFLPKVYQWATYCRVMCTLYYKATSHLWFCEYVDNGPCFQLKVIYLFIAMEMFT